MPIEPEPRGITTRRDLTPQHEDYPLLPPEIAEWADAHFRGLPNPHPEFGEMIPLDPLADPVRISGRNTTPGIRTASTEKNKGIRTAKTSGITTAHPDTSGIGTVKPIRTVKPE